MKKPPKGGKPPPHQHGGSHHQPAHHHKPAPHHQPAPHHHHVKQPQHKGHHHKKARGLALGRNVACCSAEALAASLRLAGWPVADSDVLALHRHTAGGDSSGAALAATLEAATEYGLAGVRPLGFSPALLLTPGVLVGLTLAGGPHAVTVDGHGVWTWGEWCPVDCAFAERAEEAWAVRWPASSPPTIPAWGGDDPQWR